MLEIPDFTEEITMASFSVVNNIGSVNAQQSKLFETNIGLSRTLARLSSGLRINQSGDDAAGLAVANKFRSDVAILNVGVRNANDGLSTLQIADGALDNISRLLDRAATLATQSATGTTTDNSRTVLNEEFQAILSEIDREAGIASLTTATSYSVYISNDGSNGTVTVSFGDFVFTKPFLNRYRNFCRRQFCNHKPSSCDHSPRFSSRVGGCGSKSLRLRHQHCAIPDREQDSRTKSNS
jgi:Bacterial flagellin N-terminal helical region